MSYEIMCPSVHTTHRNYEKIAEKKNNLQQKRLLQFCVQKNIKSYITYMRCAHTHPPRWREIIIAQSSWDEGVKFISTTTTYCCTYNTRQPRTEKYTFTFSYIYMCIYVVDICRWNGRNCWTAYKQQYTVIKTYFYMYVCVAAPLYITHPDEVHTHTLADGFDSFFFHLVFFFGYFFHSYTHSHDS